MHYAKFINLFIPNRAKLWEFHIFYTFFYLFFLRMDTDWPKWSVLRDDPQLPAWRHSGSAGEPAGTDGSAAGGQVLPGAGPRQTDGGAPQTARQGWGGAHVPHPAHHLTEGGTEHHLDLSQGKVLGRSINICSARDKVHKINLNRFKLFHFFTKFYVWPLVWIISSRQF